MSFRRPCGRFFIAYTKCELFSEAGQLFCFGNKVTGLSPLQMTNGIVTFLYYNR